MRRQGPNRWDNQGNWVPPIQLGWNVHRPGRNSSLYFACTGHQMGRMNDQQFRSFGAPHFRTISIYHCMGQLNVVGFDATRYPVPPAPAAGGGGGNHEGWHRMCFHWRQDGSSLVTNIGGQTRLRRQRGDQVWARRLLPDGFQAAQIEPVTNPNVGGMSGLLPLLIALVILTYPTDYPVEQLFQNGHWVMNPNLHQSMCITLFMLDRQELT